jgi:hypothetical protein
VAPGPLQTQYVRCQPYFIKCSFTLDIILGLDLPY